MDARCLTDPDTFPDNDVLQQYLGGAKVIWDAFLDLVASKHPLLSIEWKYYRDGKSWLGKLSQKKKTVCWISVYQEFFKVTFYFTDKANDIIMESSLTNTLKTQWSENAKIGKIIPITVRVKKRADLKSVGTLVGLKAHIITGK